MVRNRIRRSRKLSRRLRTYRSSPLRRHRDRVHWLLAQRSRLRNYLRRFARAGEGTPQQGNTDE